MTDPHAVAGQDIVQAWRAISLGAEFALIGIIALVIKEYRRGFVRGAGAVPRHVVLVGASYVGFVTVAGGKQVERLLAGDPLTWQLIVVTFATGLGIVALLGLLIDVRARKQRGHLRRASDPQM